MKVQEKFVRIEIVADTLTNCMYTKLNFACTIWVKLRTNYDKLREDEYVRNGELRITIHNNRVYKIEYFYEYEYNDVDDRTITEVRTYEINGDYVEHIHLKQTDPKIILELRYNNDVSRLIDLFDVKSSFYTEEVII